MVGGVVRVLMDSRVPLLELPVGEGDLALDDEAWFSEGEALDDGVP